MLKQSFKSPNAFYLRVLAIFLSVCLCVGIGQIGLSALADIVSPKAVLTTLTYDGFELADFKSGVFKGTSSTGGVYRDTMTFGVTVSSGTSDAPVVAATAEAGVTVEIEQATDLGSNNTATVSVTEGTTTNYYKLVFKVNEISSDAYLAYNYGDGIAGTYNHSEGSLNATVENGTLKLAGNAPQWVTRTDGATYGKNDVALRVRVRFESDSPRFGFHLRQKDNTHLVGFHFNAATINWASYNGSEGWSGSIGASPIRKNIWYNIKFQIEGSIATLWIDGKKYAQGDLTASLSGGYYAGDDEATAQYHFGFRSWYGAQTIYVDDWSVAPIEAEVPPAPTSTTKEVPDPSAGTFETLESDDMKVLVSKDFPLIFKYKNAEDGFLANGNHPWDAPFLQKMYINGKTVNVTSTGEMRGRDTIVYTISGKQGSDIDFTMNATLKVTSNKLRLDFTNIVENGDTFIKTFGLYDTKMVALMGADAKASLGIVNDWGPMTDKFLNLDDAAASRQYKSAYALINDDRVAAAVYNNAEDASNKYIVDEIVEDATANGSDKTLSISNNIYYWHYYNKNSKMPSDYVPYAEVIVGGEQNQFGEDGLPLADAAIDWQDAGLLYRQIAKKPFGSDDVKNYWNYIPFNMSGTATNPSLTILDRAKAISYLTDGFGQKVMNKGYQVGGHDDSHGDYKNVSLQQGGAEDFEYLNKVGKNYNVSMGIHINATEFALDGFETELENMSGYPDGNLSRNWNWLDQAFYVDKSKDIINGDLERRLDDLKKTLPNLSWIYVDVYQSGSGFMSKQLAHYINKNGWSLATEAAGDFEEDVTFFHWNTDLYYGVGGTQSQVVRFLQNDIADKFAPDRALLSMTMPSPGGWRGKEMFSEASEVFYRNNLAAKYMQHFELQQWTPDVKAKFSDGVESTVEEVSADKHMMTLTRDGKTFAKIDVSNLNKFEEYNNNNKFNPKKTGNAEIFIPWDPKTEEKIYYFNDVNAQSTWQLPASWDGVNAVYQYKLTQTGRELVDTITPTEGGSITVDGDLSTPYILSKTQQATGGLGNKRLPEATGTWGEGSEIENFGFTGALEGWNKTGEASVSTVPTYGSGSGPVDHGDTLVSFGAGGGSISQDITLKAGKTYSISVWMHTENRKAELKVEAGGKTFSNYMVNNIVKHTAQPHKFWNMNYEKLTVDVKMPADVTSAKLTYSVAAGAGQSVADDFKCWQWQTEPTRTVLGNEVYFDDFENVDSGYGPFVSAIGGEPYQHLAQKNIAAPLSQVKNFVVDGQWSLKDQENRVAPTLRTTTSELRLEQAHSYMVQFDYMAYAESRTGNDSGFNVAANKDFYRVEVRNAAGTILSSKVLPRSEVIGSGYNARPSVKKASIAVTTPAPDTYISISRLYVNEKSGDDDTRNNMISIDNFRVTRTDGIEMESVSANNGSLTMKFIGNVDVRDITPDQISAKMYVNDKLAGAVALSDLKADISAKTITANFNKIETTPVAQNIRIEVTYNQTITKSASFVVSSIEPYYLKPSDVTVKAGTALPLPTKLTVRLADTRLVELDVTYTGFDSSRPGRQTVTGTIDIGNYFVANDFVNIFTVQVTVSPTGPYYTKPGDVTVAYGTKKPLSETLEIMLADGTKTSAGVTYSGYDANKAGNQTVTGTINVTGLNVADDFVNTFTVNVKVNEQGKKGCTNIGFSSGWFIGGGMIILLTAAFAALKKQQKTQF